MRALLTRVVAAAMLLTATVAAAEHDSFGLGDGSDEDVTVSSNNKVINDYAKVTAPLAPGDLTISVDNAGAFSGPRNATDSGDLIMVLQSSGIVPSAASGDPSSVDLSFDVVGRWELARVQSKSGNTLTLTAPLLYSYAANVTQIIRVPEYESLTVQDSKGIVAKAWDGETGGVVAFLARGTVTLFGSIDASGKGFRGGTDLIHVLADLACPDSSGLVDTLTVAGAQRGEGIDSPGYNTLNSRGRGNRANGGGGGVCVRAAGGGGGHAGGGGKGGNAPSASTNGGMEGAALVYSLLDHLTFGGGGGSGHTTATNGCKGGDGGGAIFIRANTITAGASGARSIQASGGQGGNASGGSNGQGAGGGGAGGSIVLRVANSFNCAITLNATGGGGGNNGTADAAPGGGGGGGRILYQAASLSGSGCQRSVGGGAAGTNSGGTQGATAGQIGVVSSLPGGFKYLPPNLTAPTETIGSSTTTISGGSVPPRARVLIFLGGVEVGSTLADASGNFGFLVKLPDGSYSVQAAMEYQGVRSGKSNTITFTVDTKPPAVPVVTHLDTESAASGMSIQSVSPVIKGEAELGSSVEVSIDGVGGGPWPATVDASGFWELNLAALPIALAERLPPLDPYTLRVKAKDLVPNWSEAFTFNFYVDKNNPASPTVVKVADRAPGLRDPADASSLEVWANTWRLLIKGSAEKKAKVNITLDGKSVETVADATTGAWSVLLEPVASDDMYILNATATDASGRASLPTRVDVHVDTQAPDTIIEGKPGSFGDSRDANFSFTSLSTDDDVVGYTCLIGRKCESASSTVVVAVDECGVRSPVSGLYEYKFDVGCDGDFNLLVRAKDKADNLDPWPASYAWSVKTGEFVAQISLGPPNPSRSSRAVFEFESNRPTLDSYECDLEELTDGTVEVIYADDSCQKSLPCIASQGCYDLEDGLYRLRVTGLDDGIQSLPVDKSEYTWRVDTVAPVAPAVESPTVDAFWKENSFILKGTATAGYSGEELFAHIDIDGNTITTSVFPLGGLLGGWERSVTLTEGVHILRIWLQDKAGNRSKNTDDVIRTLTIDTVAPKVSIASATTSTGEPLPRSTQSGEARFSFETNELPSFFKTFECRLDGAAYAPCEATDHRLIGLPEGIHLLEVRARDKAENVSSPEAREWIVDRTPPETIIESGPNAKSPPRTESVLFSVSNTEHGAVFYQCSLDGAPFRECSSPLTLPVLAEGEHSLQIKARDEAGLEDETPMVWDWTVDSERSFRPLGGGLSCSASGGGSGALLALLGLAGTLLRSNRRRGPRTERHSCNSSYP